MQTTGEFTVNKSHSMEEALRMLYGAAPTGQVVSEPLNGSGLRSRHISYLNGLYKPSRAMQAELVKRRLISMGPDGEPISIYQKSPSRGDAITFECLTVDGHEVIKCRWQVPDPTQVSWRTMDTIIRFGGSMELPAFKERLDWAMKSRRCHELRRMEEELQQSCHGHISDDEAAEFKRLWGSIEGHAFTKGVRTREAAFDGEDKFPLIDPL